MNQPAGADGAAAAAGSSGPSTPGGLGFTLNSGESFRLFNCTSVHAPMLARGTEPADMVKVRLAVCALLLYAADAAVAASASAALPYQPSLDDATVSSGGSACAQQS